MQEIYKLFNPSEDRSRCSDGAGRLWIRAGKRCKDLGFSSPTQAIGSHVHAKDKTFIDVGMIQEVWFVSEPGMWSLILASKSAMAKEFKQILTRAVLPSIRKSGYYLDPGAAKTQLEALHVEILNHPNWTADAD
ncbi:MAG: BRO-N domain-containing protein [Plesiomonas shigelloides]